MISQCNTWVVPCECGCFSDHIIVQESHMGFVIFRIPMYSREDNWVRRIINIMKKNLDYKSSTIFHNSRIGMINAIVGFLVKKFPECNFGIEQEYDDDPDVMSMRGTISLEHNMSLFERYRYLRYGMDRGYYEFFVELDTGHVDFYYQGLMRS